jgi:uncharacterized protein (TIGR00661 family)
MKKRILFSISSLGLGHATRTLPIIKYYITNYQTHVLSSGSALVFLKKELSGLDVVFYDFQDYPPIERGEGLAFYYHIVIDSLVTLYRIRKENTFINKLVKEIKPEFIISDGRYGSYVKGIPSFLISHQISFVMPNGLGLFQKLADYVNYKTFKKFEALLIPDYEDLDYNLAGKMSHHPMLEKLKHYHVGILSSLKKHDKETDIDVLFSTGGFLSGHKTSFLDSLLEQAKQIEGNKVFVLGKIDGLEPGSLLENDIKIISHVTGEERNNLFNQAKVVVTRSGYTTIMDLVELDKPGILIPTPGQTEQEYLAEFLHNRKHFLSVKHTEVIYSHHKHKSNILFKPLWKTDVTLQKIHEIVTSYLNKK